MCVETSSGQSLVPGTARLTPSALLGHQAGVASDVRANMCVARAASPQRQAWLGCQAATHNLSVPSISIHGPGSIHVSTGLQHGAEHPLGDQCLYASLHDHHSSPTAHVPLRHICLPLLVQHCTCSQWRRPAHRDLQATWYRAASHRCPTACYATSSTHSCTS